MRTLEEEKMLCNSGLQKNIRETFIRGFIHDLRTPIMVTKLSAQLIQKRDDLENIREISLKIARSAEQMEALVKDFLNSNDEDSENVPLSIKQIDLKLTLLDIIDDHTKLHGNRFNILLDDDILGFWDERAIARITDNLISNAIKYGSIDEQITLVAENRNHEVVITVQNLGGYIAPSDINSIFLPKFRVLNEKNVDGWGIGLTVVKTIVEAHGGTIEVRSSQEKGTIFTVILPRDARSMASM